MTAGATRLPNWVPYLVPYLLFALFSWLGAEVGGFLHLSYPVKTVIVAGALLFFWRIGSYPELDLKPSLLGVGAGMLGFFLWVLPEEALSGLPKLGDATSFDPHGAGEAFFLPLVAARLAGASLVVPVFEELFLRSFLLRWFDAQAEDRDDFRTLPIGRYRPLSFAVVVAAMALTHHRWLRAGLYSALITAVLYREKRMGPVIWAHAITNFALGLYVVRTGQWSFW